MVWFDELTWTNMIMIDSTHGYDELPSGYLT